MTMGLLERIKLAKAASAKLKGNSAGVYNQNGVTSIGGKLGPVGAALGMDHGVPFGSANVNGKVVGSFGPQGNDSPPKPKTPQLHMEPRDLKKKGYA